MRLSDPASSPIQRTLSGAVKAYRLFLSPWLGSSCRFEPTCSLYALEALEAYGAAGGSYLALRRLIRCHPGCPGGHDPVPARAGLRDGAAPSSSTTDASARSTTPVFTTKIPS